MEGARGGGTASVRRASAEPTVACPPNQPRRRGEPARRRTRHVCAGTPDTGIMVPGRRTDMRWHSAQNRRHAPAPSAMTRRPPLPRRRRAHVRRKRATGVDVIPTSTCINASSFRWTVASACAMSMNLCKTVQRSCSPTVETITHATLYDMKRAEAIMSTLTSYIVTIVLCTRWRYD